MRVSPVLAVAATTLLGGCTQPELRPTFVNGTPEERTMAVVEAVRADDTSKVPQLITMLSSEDAAQRMIASEALERLTGQSLGYNYADPEPLRNEAIARWKRWHEAREGSTS